MLYWTGVFLVMAIVAAVFAFGGSAGDAAAIARVFFFVTLPLFALTLLGSAIKR